MNISVKNCTWNLDECNCLYFVMFFEEYLEYEVMNLSLYLFPDIVQTQSLPSSHLLYLYSMAVKIKYIKSQVIKPGVYSRWTLWPFPIDEYNAEKRRKEWGKWQMWRQMFCMLIYVREGKSFPSEICIWKKEGDITISCHISLSSPI